MKPAKFQNHFFDFILIQCLFCKTKTFLNNEF